MTGIVGLIPAAGSARRLGLLPCSKEILPVGFYPDAADRRPPIRTACTYLMERMSIAGVRKAYIIIRKGKLDIAEYLGSGDSHGLKVAYLVADNGTPGVPFTLDMAYLFLQDNHVVLGFPDILFEPKDALRRLMEREAETGADIVLGLFPASNPAKTDMVGLDQDKRVVEITIKPSHTNLRYTWIIAVWTGVFARFMHEFVSARKDINQGGLVQPEPFLGDVIQAAIHNGLIVENVIFEQGSYLDIGTPEDLVNAIRSTI